MEVEVEVGWRYIDGIDSNGCPSHGKDGDNPGDVRTTTPSKPKKTRTKH
jgi:hypothetical protein